MARLPGAAVVDDVPDSLLREDAIQEPAHHDDKALIPWIDVLAQAVAAGVRLGERRMQDPVEPRTLSVETPRDPEVMDVAAVAAFLGVDRKTVYDYAGRGEIPCRRLGKRILFSRSALVSWLGSCKTASHANGE